MLEKFLENDAFVRMMVLHVNEIINLLLDEDEQFFVVAKLEGVSFDPALPKDITESFGEIISFDLKGYTYSSIELDERYLKFEAGFGSKNIGSVVSIRLDKILQIAIDEVPIFINQAISSEDVQEEEQSSIDKSLKAMLSNIEKEKSLKK